MASALAVAAVALLSVLSVLGGTATAGPTIDLDRPGALAMLERANPAHFAKVERILDGVGRFADADVPRWMRIAFDARDVGYVPIVLTSHPAQRRLSFSLDDTRYIALIVLPHLGGGFVPLR